jgi:1-acyl-sn-glycerol-3-phosphate acyltransferase
MSYILFRGLFRIFYSLLYRWEVIGYHHVPAQGPLVLVSNHISNLDPPLLGSSAQRKVYFMAKEELFRFPLLRALIQSWGAFPVKRGAADRQSIRYAMNLLKEGEAIGVFPEGTRSKTGKLGKGLSGAALFALRSDAVVIPVAIVGPYRLFGKLKVVFGEPIDLSSFKEEGTSESLAKATEAMMASIQRLLDQHLKS